MFATSSDGTRIALFTKGQGPSILLVHGTACDHRDWDAVLPHLTKTFTVHAMDRRGRGPSKEAGTHSIAAEAADIQAAAQACNAKAIVAHSYGALCTLQAALKWKGTPPMVLYEPPIPQKPGPAPQAADLDDPVLHHRYETALRRFLKREAGMPREAQDAMKAADPDAWDACVATAPTLAREVRSAAAYALDEAAVRAISTPILLVSGGQSPPHLAEPVARLAGLLPNARSRVMEAQDHGALQRAPKEFAGLVGDFLATTAVATKST